MQSAIKPNTLQAAGLGMPAWMRQLADLVMLMALVFTITPDAFDYSSLDKVSIGTNADYGFVARVQWFPFFGLSILLIAWRWRISLLLLRHFNPYFSAVMIWICLTAFWSYDASITIRRAFKIFGMLWVVFAYIVVTWDAERLLRLTRNTMFGLCIASIVMVIVRPDLGVHQGILEPGLKGMWRGVATHKNSFGMVATIAIFLWVQALVGHAVSWQRCIIPILVGFICLLGAHSSTSIMATLIAIAITLYYFVLPAKTKSPAFYILLLMITCGAVCLLMIASGSVSPIELINWIAGLFGKDTSFTGRDLIWAAVLKEVAKHPWLGCGYNAFWIATDYSSPSADVIRAIRFTPLQSHNGYLEVLNELGIIGLTLLILLLIYQFFQLKRVHAINPMICCFGLVYVIYDIVLNITEANFLRPTFLPCMIEFMVAVMCAAETAKREFSEAQKRTEPINNFTSASLAT